MLRLSTILFSLFCSLFVSVQIASAHGAEGDSILDLPRCSARSTSCQIPVDTSEVLQTLGDHRCIDGMGAERTCQLGGPFEYIFATLPYVERDLPRLEPLGFTPCVDGMADRYPCENVDLLSFLPLADIGGGEGADLWGWTDPETGREYALMGRTNGVSFVDVTEPTAPLYLGDLPTYSGKSALWRDLKVYKDHAYIVQDSVDKSIEHGVQIFDLRQLRSVANPPTLFETTAHYSLIHRAHNIFINEDTGYGYVVGSRGGDYTCAAGLHMLDLSEPAAPRFAGCFSDDGYTHDTQCVIYRGPDLSYQGREICFNSNEDTLTIADVTNKDAPQLLSIAEYESEPVNEELEFIYVHQGWLTEDQRIFFQDDEGDEEYTDGITTRTNIWDVSDLRAPQWLGFHDLGTDSSDHNLYIQGTYLYEANYSSGLRVLRADLTDRPTLTEFGYFDTSPENSESGFDDGAWTAYPYFKSGSVIVSGKSEGLFVVAPQEPPEFTLTPLNHHSFACNTVSEWGTAVTAQLPPMIDSATEIRVSGYNDYQSTVILSATVASMQDVPLTGTLSLDMNQVTFPISDTNSATVLADFGQDWATGTYSLTVSGDDGESRIEASATVYMSDAKPLPTSGLQHTFVDSASREVTLAWNTVDGPQLQRIEMSSQADFSTLVEHGQSAGASYTAGASLALDSTYYWRVRSLNGCGEAVSEVATIQTNAGVYIPFWAIQ